MKTATTQQKERRERHYFEIRNSMAKDDNKYKVMIIALELKINKLKESFFVKNSGMKSAK